MIVQGPNGVNTADKIFLQCESGDTLFPIARGEWCMWDTTDNTSTAGIMMNTYGIRVIRSNAVSSYAVAGCAEEAVDMAVASKRGPTFLVQCYGFHDAAIVFGAGGIAGEYVIISWTGGVGWADNSTTLIGAAVAGFIMENTDANMVGRAVFVRTMK